MFSFCLVVVGCLAAFFFGGGEEVPLTPAWYQTEVLTASR